MNADEVSYAEWRASGGDKGSDVVTSAGFTNPAAGDYSFAPGAVALAQGIPQLPWSQIGLTGTPTATPTPGTAAISQASYSNDGATFITTPPLSTSTGAGNYGGAAAATSTGYATISGGTGADTLNIAASGADVTGGAGANTFGIGDGDSRIEDFVPGTDKLQLAGLVRSDIHTSTATSGGVRGLLVTYDLAGDSVFLAGVTRIGSSSLTCV